MTEVTLFVPIDPVPKGRPKVFRGKAVTPDKTQRFEENLGLLAHVMVRKHKGFRPFGKPCEVELHISVPPKARGDLDNYVKSALDAFNGVLWEDDSQVVRIQATLYRKSKRPGIGVRVSEPGPMADWGPPAGMGS